MTRYNLPDAKRGELTEMINSESKRLARIISTFLDVERRAGRRSDGTWRAVVSGSIQGEVDTCMRRATPLAERKHIAMSLDSAVDGPLLGDRELLEYALYNLLTNARREVPRRPDTGPHVYSELHGRQVHGLSVRRIRESAWTAKETKTIFPGIYPTERAEASGESGTGMWAFDCGTRSPSGT